MTEVRRALAISFLERYGLIALTLIGYFVIARLLTPEEIGIYSVATALIGMAQVIRDFGIGNYLVQERSLTKSHIGTAFGISLLIGGTMFLVFITGASFIGDFYDDQRMAAIVQIVALNFLIIPFGAVSMSLLKREMAFARLMTVNILAAAAGLAVTLLLAWKAWGPQSLAWGAITTSLVTAFGVWVARKEKTFIRPSLKHWRAIVSFGGQSTLAGVVTSIAMDINDLVVGKVMGFSPVAILSRAQGIMNLFHRDIMSAIRNVAFPVFAKSYREGEEIEPRFSTSVTAITAFAWPFYGFIALYPLEILRLMFGPQWDSAASLVPIFALAGAFAATYTLIPSVIIAVGRVDLITRAELLFQPLRVAMIIAAAVFFKSLVACALAFCISFAIAAPVFFLFKQRCVPNNYNDLIKGLSKSGAVTLFTLSLAILCSFTMGIRRDSPIGLGLFALICAGTAMLWFLSVAVLKHPISKDPLFKRITTKFIAI